MTDIEPELLQRALNGDGPAQAVLYRTYAPMVFTLARRMLGSTSLAEDIVQESFVEVIRKGGQYRGEAGVGFWIRRIALNKCLSQLRSPWFARRVEPSATDPDLDVVAAAGRGRQSSPEHDLVDRLALERALDALPATARAVVWLHDVEGYTHQEIGRLMGRTTSFSKSQLARAYAQLRAVLQSEAEEMEPCLGALRVV